MSEYQLSLITPDGKIFEGAVTSVVAPGCEGSFGVKAQHAPMVALLKEGVLKIQSQNNNLNYNIGPGILEVSQSNQCLILSDRAHPAN